MANIKASLLLGLVVVAVAAAATAQAAVTIYNPVGLVLEVVAGDGNVRVATGMVTVNVTEGQEQDIQVKLGTEGAVTLQVHVQDGDVLVLIPDPSDPLHSLQVLKVQAGSVQLLPNSVVRPQEDQTATATAAAAALP